VTLYLGLDLGGTNVRAVVAQPAPERPHILGDASLATPATGRPADVIAALAECARAALAEADRPLHDVVAAGCAAPGPLDHRSGLVHIAPNIPGFREVSLAADLSSALDGLAVFVDRDTVIAAIGEGLAGAARGVRDYVYVTVSTGVGAGIVSGGRMLRGASNTAGEVGHWPVALAGPKCGCGSYGCVESFAGGRNLAQQFGSAEASDVFRADRAGDARARELVANAEAALEALAIGLVNVLNPARIVVGGGITEHEPDHVLMPMRRGVRDRAFKVASAACEIVASGLGSDVGMIGAVLAAQQRAAGAGEWFA
jgi:glucokinase